MQVQIKFIKSGSNSAFGSFEPGGLLRCSDEVAKHLVEEAGVAKYVEAPVAAVEKEVSGDGSGEMLPPVSAEMREAKPVKRKAAKAK